MLRPSARVTPDSIPNMMTRTDKRIFIKLLLHPNSNEPAPKDTGKSQETADKLHKKGPLTIEHVPNHTV
jgi:hypothetical protein